MSPFFMGNGCGPECVARYERDLEDFSAPRVNEATVAPKDGDPRAGQEGATYPSSSPDPSCAAEHPTSVAPGGARSSENLTGEGIASPGLAPSLVDACLKGTSNEGEAAHAPAPNPVTAAAPAAVTGAPSPSCVDEPRRVANAVELGYPERGEARSCVGCGQPFAGGQMYVVDGPRHVYCEPST